MFIGERERECVRALRYQKNLELLELELQMVVSRWRTYAGNWTGIL